MISKFLIGCTAKLVAIITTAVSAEASSSACSPTPLTLNEDFSHLMEVPS